MNCYFTTEQLDDGRYRHTCEYCERSLTTQRANVRRECKAKTCPVSQSPALPDNDRWTGKVCIYRGEELRQALCKTCGDRGKTVPVFTCVAFPAGECTEKRTNNWPIIRHCFGCPAKTDPR